MRETSNPTVSDYIDGWETARRAAGIRPGTIRLQRHYLIGLNRFLAGRPVTIDLVDVFLSRPGWAANTRHSAASAVRSFLRYATRRGLGFPPADLLDMPPAAPGHARPADTDAIRRAVMGSNLETRLAILLGACCGLRRAEIAGLAWHDIDTRERVLYVTGKGGKPRRIPYTHPALVDALAAADHSTPWVFPSPRKPGRPVTPDHIGVIVKRALSRAGHHRVTCHQLRHRFATDTHAATGDLLTTQELLGHSSPATTQIYVQVPADRLRAAVSDVGGYL